VCLHPTGWLALHSLVSNGHEMALEMLLLRTRELVVQKYQGRFQGQQLQEKTQQGLASMVCHIHGKHYKPHVDEATGVGLLEKVCSRLGMPAPTEPMVC
jgi:hypothetical protein